MALGSRADTKLRPFVVYFHAEVKVELSFHPPLTVLADAETTSVVVDFEAKMADGFTRIEIGG